MARTVIWRRWVCFWILLFLGTASACTPTDDTAPTAVSAATIPHPTAIPLATITPQVTATATPQPTLTPTPTITPTATATPCRTPGAIETAVFPSLTAGNMNVRVYLPPCYGSNGRSYPVLFLLPGNIHTDAIWDELGVDETAETLIQADTIPPLIIVMPDGGWVANNTSGGPGSYETVIVNDLIPFVEEQYCVWPAANGRAIGGLSRGGYWALEIAFRHPQLFASVGGHSAALLDRFAGPAFNPQQTALSQDLGDLRIYLDIGESDYVIHNVRRLHEAMTAAGIAHTWVLNNGRHENAYWSAHLEEYLQWYTVPWPHRRGTYPPCPSR